MVRRYSVKDTFRGFSGKSPGNLQKLPIYAKFPHQEISWTSLHLTRCFRQKTLNAYQLSARTEGSTRDLLYLCWSLVLIKLQEHLRTVKCRSNLSQQFALFKYACHLSLSGYRSVKRSNTTIFVKLPFWLEFWLWQV